MFRRKPLRVSRCALNAHFDDIIRQLNFGHDDEIDNFISDEVPSSFYWRSTVASGNQGYECIDQEHEVCTA
jgi:hypothetical protein